MSAKGIGIAVGITSLIGGLFAMDARYEHQVRAAEEHERMEQKSAQNDKEGLADTQRQILEMRIDLYRLKLDRLRKTKAPTDDDKDEIAYLRSTIATIRAQLEGLDKG